MIDVDSVPELGVYPVDLDSASEAAQVIAARMEGRDIIDTYAVISESGIVQGLALVADHDPECEVSAVLALDYPGTAQWLLEGAAVAARAAGYSRIWLDGREADYTIGQNLPAAAQRLGWEPRPGLPWFSLGYASASWWTLDLTATPDTPQGPTEPLDADCGV